MAIWYGQAMPKALNKEWDWDSDDIRITLHTVGYVPARTTHAYVSDLTSELATAAGYTVGGVALTGKSVPFTAANNWATTRANSTAYAVGDVVRPATGNGFLYRAVAAGTSAASIPTYPTAVGATVVDGGETWVNEGTGITQILAGNPSWATATFTGVRIAVISNRTPATAATQPLIGFVDFGTDQAGGGGSFSVAFHATGALHLFSP